MSSKALRFLILFSIINLSACAASGPKFKNEIEPPPDKSLIYIYRPWAFTSGGVGLPIMHGGEQLPHLLHNKGYLNYLADAGRHEIHVNANGLIDRKLQFDSEPGKTYYIKLTIQNYFAVIGTRLLLVERDEAIKEMKDLKLSEAGNSLNPSIQESAPIMRGAAKSMNLASQNETINKTLIADEIRKLDELRIEGIITQEEFNERKSKALDL